MSTDHAGVKFPPPLILLTGILSGVALDFALPSKAVPEGLAMPFGIAFVALALGIVALGMRELKRHATTIRPNEPSAAIVRTGPFRYSRNPLYISLSTLQLGIGVWANNLWIIAMLVPALAVVRTQVIAREEAYLERRFGDDYLSYKAAVRRWL